ncbi:MAG TPA: hypothetical protein VMW48_02940 [Vicinamibacterales bacterium]|nr:hypothetical protein [Vicinamibacterales bacterium]
MARTKETAKLELAAYLTSMSREEHIDPDEFLHDAYSCAQAKGLTKGEATAVIYEWSREVREAQGVK